MIGKAILPKEPFMYKDFSYARNTLQHALHTFHPYILLTGESGTGKTMLLRIIKNAIEKKNFSILYCSLTKSSAYGLEQIIADKLHLPLRKNKTDTAKLILQTLQIMPQRLIILLDEAHYIHEDTLHQIRMLSEATLEYTSLFSVVFSALPVLRKKLMEPQLLPLLRRIKTKVKLQGVVHEEMEPFVKHLNIKVDTFSAQALACIFEQARGIPALIENLLFDTTNKYQNKNITQQDVINIIEQQDC